MNNVAIMPKLCMRLLQSQNVKRQIAPTVNLEESSEEGENDNDKKEN